MPSTATQHSTAVAELDARAVAGIRAGDTAAFREIFDRYQQPVFRLCARYHQLDREQVADLVQRVFVRAFQKINELKKPGQFRYWLFSMAKNLAISELRKHKTETNALKSYLLHSPQSSKYTELSDPYYREQMLAAVEHIVAELSDQTTKEIVSMYYGPTRITTAAISDQLGVPKGTVTVKLQRFRQYALRCLTQKLLDHDSLAASGVGR